MPDERLEQIKERLAAATPGPWNVLYDDGSLHGTPEEYFVNFDAHRDTTNIDRPADAAFIANAPSDIAYLLAEVERLRAALVPLKASHDALIASVTPPNCVDVPSDEYDALFSEWHAATRSCIAALAADAADDSARGDQ